MTEPISLAEYRKIVEHVTTSGAKIPKILVDDITDWKCRSMLGRHLARSVRDYHNAEKILRTVIDRPIETEENAWCQLDFSVCKYNIDGNVELALKRVQVVRKWVVDNEANLDFLSVGEVERIISTLKIIRKHKIRNRRKNVD